MTTCTTCGLAGVHTCGEECIKALGAEVVKLRRRVERIEPKPTHVCSKCGKKLRMAHHAGVLSSRIEDAQVMPCPKCGGEVRPIAAASPRDG